MKAIVYLKAEETGQRLYTYSNAVDATVNSKMSSINSGGTFTDDSGATITVRWAKPFTDVVLDSRGHFRRGTADGSAYGSNANFIEGLPEIADGDTGKVVKVNATETGFELSTDETGGGGGGSAPIGSLAFGRVAPDATYRKCNGQILAQADYATLYSNVGHLPEFTTEVLNLGLGPSGLKDIAYSSALGLYLGVVSTNASPGVYYIAKSTDAINWVGVATGFITGAPLSIVWDPVNAVFIASFSSSGNTTGSFATSADGINWRHSYSPQVGSSHYNWLAVRPSDGRVVAVAGGGGLITTDDGGVNWTIRSSGTTSTLTHVMYSTDEGLFVAVGDSGRVITSPDGITWTTRTSNTSNQLQSCAYSPALDLFVAVGNSGTIITSPDGSAWTVRTSGTTQLFMSIDWSASQAMFIAAAGQWVFRSTDGITWTCVASSIISAIAYGNSTYVAVGSMGSCLTSADATTWTPRRTGAGSSTFNWVTYAGGSINLFVAVGAGGIVYTSPDGITWTSRTSNTSNALNHVIYSSDEALLVAVGASGTIITSPDGSAWTARTSNAGGNALNAVCYSLSLDLFVAVGAAGTIVTSPDGTTWTARTSGTTFGVTGIDWSPSLSKFLASTGSQSSLLLSSTDGTTWTKLDPETGANNYFWVYWSEDLGKFFLTNNSNQYFVSTDGLTFSSRFQTGIGSSTPRIMLYANSKLFGTSGSDIGSSTDGDIWTTAYKGTGFSTFNRVYWADSVSKFIIASSAGIFSSTNGDQWSSWGQLTNTIIAKSENDNVLLLAGGSKSIMRSTDAGATWAAVEWPAASSSFQAMASDGNAIVAIVGSTLLHSADGLTWTHRQVQNETSLTHITYGNSLWVAVANKGGIYTSSDTITWTKRTFVSTTDFSFVAYLNNIFVATGTAGRIVTSTDGITWTDRGSFAPGATFNWAAYHADAQLYIAGGSTGHLFAISSNGTTWNRGSVSGLGGVVVEYIAYDAVDKCLVANSSTAGVGLLFSHDGVSFDDRRIFTATTWLGAASRQNIFFDSTNDKLFTVHQQNVLMRHSRRYTKATQFALPTLPNTWIKATT